MASRSGTSISISESNAGVVAVGNVNTGNINVNCEVNYCSSPENDFPLPQLIKTFRGREDEFTLLDDLFFKQEKLKIVLCALPGFGKSELSKQYAKHCLDNKTVEKVLWIPSENPQELKNSYRKLKQIYDNCPERRYLFVFDNGLSRRSIADYEPPDNANYRILITSHDKSWGNDVTPVQLESLSLESAIKVFEVILCNKYKDEDYGSYVNLAAAVSNIPLGLQIIAGYVGQEDEEINLKEYADDLKRSQNKIIDKVIPDCVANSYEKSIYDAMKITLTKIKEKKDKDSEIRQLALEVLFVSSYLNPDEIPMNDLLVIFSTNNYQYSQELLTIAIKLLMNFSFIYYYKESRYKKPFIALHRLTQTFTRKYLVDYDLQCKYYTYCLNFAFNSPVINDYYLVLSRHIASILNYADLNISTVLDFHKNVYDEENFLRYLASYGCIKCVKFFFENPDQKTAEKIYRYNLLFETANTNAIDIFKFFLQYIDVKTKDKHLNKILIYLVGQNHLDLIKIVKELGADVNIKNDEGEPLIFTFASRDNTYCSTEWDWADLLYTFKFNKYITNSKQETLLHRAVTYRNVKLTQLLVEKYDVIINQKDIRGWTPLDILYDHIINLTDYETMLFGGTTTYDSNKKLLKLLLKHGASSNIEHTKEGDSCDFLLLYYYSFKYSEFEFLKFLLDHGFDVNSTNKNRETILHKSVFEFNLKATKMLVEHGADLNAKDNRNNTPLFKFIHETVRYYSNWNEVKEMLDILQLNPNNIDAEGNTILHVAVENGIGPLVDLLLKNYKFNINHQNVIGCTPLHTSVLALQIRFMYKKMLLIHEGTQLNIVYIIETLIDSKACLYVKNKSGETPLQIWQRLYTNNNYMEHLIPYYTLKYCKCDNNMFCA